MCKRLIAVLIVKIHFFTSLLVLSKYVCTVYFLMDALASVKLDNKYLLTKKMFHKNQENSRKLLSERTLYHHGQLY